MRRFKKKVLSAAPSTLVDPLRAQIPANCDPLHGEIFGVDDQSYFHIGFSEPSIYELYHSLMTQMELTARDKGCLPKHLLKRTGSHCIVEYRGRRGGIYVRGKIVEIVSEADDVRCHLIDDYKEVSVHISQIFHTNDEILRFPKFSLKCQLDDMECFLGYPYMKNVFTEFMKGEWKPGVRNCTVKILDPHKEIPTVRLITCEGKNLACLLQEYIPILSKVEYPLPGVAVKAKLVYCDASGKMWFQLWGDHQLSHVIKFRLQQYNCGHIPVKATPQVSPWSWWKNYFFSGPGELFIVKDTIDDRCYRVRINSRNIDGTVQVNFIDYGYTEDVYEEALIPAHRIDPNLCFISPQCLAVKFVGTQQFNEENPFEVTRFWKYIRRQPISIVIKDYGVGRVGERLKGLIVPEADVLVKTLYTPVDHPGHSLAETLGYVNNKSANPIPQCDDDTDTTSITSSDSSSSTTTLCGDSQDDNEKFASIDINNNVCEEKTIIVNNTEQKTKSCETDTTKPENNTTVISLLEEPIESKRSTWVDWVLEQIDNPESALSSGPSSLPTLPSESSGPREQTGRRRRRLFKF